MHAVWHSFTGRTRLAILFTLVLLATFASSELSASEFDSGIVNFDQYFIAQGSITQNFPAYGPGPAAIGSAGDLWNTLAVGSYGPYVSPLNLYNADGAATSVKWSYLGGGGYVVDLLGTYGRLVDAGTAFQSATITGLTPNQQYNLYWFNPYYGQVISVNGIDFATDGIQIAIVDSLTAGIEYDVHTVTADSSGTLAFVPISTQVGVAFFCSWELTPVPEPSTISLAGLGLLAFAALGITRSQRRRS